MRLEVVNKTGSLAGTSELTVAAPIKTGFVPSLDAVTYKTRVMRVLHTLHLGRSAAHEHELARVLSDAVERVGRIHSVSIRVLEPDDKVVLSVVFDGAWEAYVRVIWQKVARLLDLIFCNTEGYRLGWESSYEDWGAWLKGAQCETAFLYATPGVTVADTRYLQMLERRHRRGSGAPGDLAVAELRIPTAEEIAELGIFGNDTAIGIDPTNAGCSTPLDQPTAGHAPFVHGLRSLAGLHRLSDLHLPGTPDGTVLLRAARELLPEFMRMVRDGNTYQTGLQRGRERFDEAVRWFEQPDDALPAVRIAPPRPTDGEPGDRRNVQGGILEAYPDVAHGGLLLLGFASAAALAAFLDAVRNDVTTAQARLEPDAIATNLAFTAPGLRCAGLPEELLRAFPDEFVQGMESRAGLLGDLRINHPRRWRLPAHNWHLGAAAPDPAETDRGPRISLAAVHAVLQLRLRTPAAGKAPAMAPRDRLFAEMQRLVKAHPGVTALSLQWMTRLDREGAVVEHFGFTDGKANPVFKKADAGRYYPENQVQLGEVLCGYPNRVDHVAAREGVAAQAQALLRDGSFLVIRKLRQDVDALETALAQAVAAPVGPALSREALLAQMMGRWPTGHARAGEPLAKVVSGAPENDFVFDADPAGATCPLHAHIRRANPRENRPEPMSRPARIVRRGMSYGEWHDRDATDPERRKASLAKERGAVFMAYNASIGEQFEVVQGWLAGGNSAASYSGQSDPFCGVAEPGRRRFFRFEHEGQTCRMALDGSDALHAEPQPFVRLEWGAYLFAPSVATLDALHKRAAAAAQAACPAVAWDVEIGRAAIERLREAEMRDGAEAAALAWKAMLEDPQAAVDFKTASVWASIRVHHGGVLKTPFGTLVADAARVDQMLVDSEHRLSANGYLPRMRRAFGDIYLGLDADQDAYERESRACNQAIMALPAAATFEAARASTLKALDALVERAQHHARDDGEASWDLTLDARELIDPLLADLCEKWFGLSEEGGFFKRSGHRWDWQEGDPAAYPGHFLAPSRYFFQPHPGAQVESFGAVHGAALHSAMTAFLHAFARSVSAPVARAVLDAKLDSADYDYSARTLVGAVMGFVPTVDGNLRRILNEWLREGALWSLRGRYAATPACDLEQARERIDPEFTAAMQLRTTPEMLWRTATVSHCLGKPGPHQVTVAPGEIVVGGLASATQQCLAEQPRGAIPPQGDPGAGLYAAFGGDRWSKNPRPTHACPGARAAMAAMIGFFSALVETAHPLRAGPGPLTLSLEGRFEPAPAAPTGMAKGSPAQSVRVDGPGVDATVFSDAPMLRNFTLTSAAATVTSFVTLGDSWVSPLYAIAAPNLLKPLARFGCERLKSFGSAGALLEEMASPAVLDKLLYYLDQLDPATGPRALLISGGGNDVVYPTSEPKKSPLYRMLRQNPAAGVDPLIEDEVRAFIDETLFGHYCTIIDAVAAKTPIPIVIHAYDHPRPDGRWALLPTHPGPWLKPVFSLREISTEPDGAVDNERARDAIRRLIDRLDAVAERLTQKYPGRVHHAKLCGTLEGQADYAADYTLFWDNELHATARGFELLAKVVADKLIEVTTP